MLTRHVAASGVRQDEIMLRVLAQRTVRIKDLAVDFAVSEMTIRRELDHLAELGQLERIHGGARLCQHASEEASYQQRSLVQAAAKERMALAALELIHNGDSIGLDASTSALALARILPARRVQAILTGLDSVEAVMNSPIDFFVCGGFFHAKARSFVGATAIESLNRLHPDKVFFSTGGFTVEDGFTDPNPQEADTKRALLKGGALKVALVDHTKFGRRALASTARLNEVDVFITDQQPSEELRDALEQEDVRLIVAEDRGQKSHEPN
jgi:DeoR/GlpR family transcriptional regulator of sugar metabolism